MPVAVTLRTPSLDDAAEFARLATELGYPVSVQDMRDRLEALLLHPDHFIRVGEGNNAICGWVAVQRRRTLEAGERMEIVGLIVDMRWRGKGVGRTLVAEAEQWARQAGFDSMMVRSNIERDASHPFYESLGYVRRKTQHVYVKSLDAI